MNKHYKETKFGVELFAIKVFVVIVFIIRNINILYFYYHLYLKCI